jgi:hypothetical protein
MTPWHLWIIFTTKKSHVKKAGTFIKHIKNENKREIKISFNKQMKFINKNNKFCSAQGVPIRVYQSVQELITNEQESSTTTNEN